MGNSKNMVEVIVNLCKTSCPTNLHPEELQALKLLSNENGNGTSEMAFPTNLASESSVFFSSVHQPSTSKHFYEYFKFRIERDSPSDARNALLVIAVLVATASYQVGLSPPGGTWQDNSIAVGSNNSDSYQMPIAGTSILGTYYPDVFTVMIGLNSFAFMVSLSMIAMLTSRFPFRIELLICIVFHIWQSGKSHYSKESAYIHLCIHFGRAHFSSFRYLTFKEISWAHDCTIWMQFDEVQGVPVAGRVFWLKISNEENRKNKTCLSRILFYLVLKFV